MSQKLPYVIPFSGLLRHHQLRAAKCRLTARACGRRGDGACPGAERPVQPLQVKIPAELRTVLIIY